MEPAAGLLVKIAALWDGQDRTGASVGGAVYGHNGTPNASLVREAEYFGVASKY